ncbi:hypothetical protein RR48_08396 [Papilio machaon]|uniref:Uncharacterized protein n=1 Tax=Papilio machaon TaxID=76193 RepID=A0A194R2A9_PAPMA|nr:hypothetical protein RR48_08396 [Papilio machaon]
MAPVVHSYEKYTVQTGCRPDLAQFRPVVTLEGMSGDQHVPYIPCEFCAHHLPLDLIGDHQSYLSIYSAS